MIAELTTPRVVALLVCVASLGLAKPAQARKNGIQVAGCWGCHQQNGDSTLTLTPDHSPIELGDTVGFEAVITWPGVKVGGIYVVKPDLGTLGTSAGQGLTLSDGALTHSSPKAAVGDTVTFDFTWTAPEAPGAVTLQTYFNAANGDGKDTGDSPGDGSLSFVFGCEPSTFYFDLDGDGYGGTAFPTVIGCADQPPPAGYSLTGDDCDEDHADIHPGAPERCNGKDDNCNGQIDENTTPELLYPDPDGDGYYGANPGDGVLGCLPLAGYADQPGDCAEGDASRFPGAKEICNLLDDDCDGLVDEGVRPQCGLGRCATESPTCDLKGCFPGTPRSETCNGIDDDCNGVVDDGDLCGADAQCLGTHCVPLDSATTPSAGSASSDSSAATGGTARIAPRPVTSSGCTLSSKPSAPAPSSGLAVSVLFLVCAARRRRR